MKKLIYTVLFLLISLACNREEKVSTGEQKNTTEQKSTAVQETSATPTPSTTDSIAKGSTSFTSELISRVPENALGFIHFNYEGKAGKRFLASPYAKSDYGSHPSANTAPIKSIQSILGIDLLNISEHGKLFSEGLIFIASDEKGAGIKINPTFGGVYKLKPEAQISDKLEKVLEILKKEKVVKIEPYKLTKGAAYKIILDTSKAYILKEFAIVEILISYYSRNFFLFPIALTDALEINELFVTTEENNLYYSTDKAVLDNILSNSSSYSTSFAQNKFINSLSQGMTPSADRIGFTYFDIKSLIKTFEFDNFMSIAKLKDILYSLESLVIDSSFIENSLINKIKLGLSPKGEFVSKLVNFKASSASTADLSKVLPSQNILATLGVDFGFIYNIYNLLNIESLIDHTERELLKPLLSSISATERLVLTVKLPPFTSSFISKRGFAKPAKPEFAIIVNNPDSTKLRTTIIDYVTNSKGLRLFSMPVKWENKKIENTDVDYVMQKFGFGLFVASYGDNLILSSSESLIKDTLSIINGTNQESFNKMAPGAIVDTFNKVDSTVSIYFNHKVYNNYGDMMYSLMLTKRDSQVIRMPDNSLMDSQNALDKLSGRNVRSPKFPFHPPKPPLETKIPNRGDQQILEELRPKGYLAMSVKLDSNLVSIDVVQKLEGDSSVSVIAEK